jgi:hypothetical protein
MENCNVDNLHSKPKCYVVLKAFSISMNTAAVDHVIVEIEGYVVRKASYIEWYCAS